MDDTFTVPHVLFRRFGDSVFPSKGGLYVVNDDDGVCMMAIMMGMYSRTFGTLGGTYYRRIWTWDIGYAWACDVMGMGLHIDRIRFSARMG